MSRVRAPAYQALSSGSPACHGSWCMRWVHVLHMFDMYDMCDMCAYQALSSGSPACYGSWFMRWVHVLRMFDMYDMCDVFAYHSGLPAFGAVRLYSSWCGLIYCSVMIVAWRQIAASWLKLKATVSHA